MLIVAGLHVPAMPLVEEAGSAGAVLFWQSGPSCVKAGVTWLVITTSIVATLPHWPAAGVKVYVVVPVVAVLIVAGLHVPEMPLVDDAGSAGAVLFWQSGPIWVNVGVTWVVITTFIVATLPHWPAAGVKV